jgi:hypothetical protein
MKYTYDDEEEYGLYDEEEFLSDDELEDMYFAVEVSCICEHDPRDHGWISCEVVGCDCNAHWEE